MLALRRLTKRFSQQTLSEVKPAPLSETVDRTLEEEAFPMPPHKAFEPSPSASPSSSPAESSDSSEGESDEEEEEEEEVLPASARVQAQHRRQHLIRRELPRHRELAVDRVPSAEKRKYSQYKCSTGGSSSASSSDDEVKEAFESCLPSTPIWPGPTPYPTHWSPAQRPIRVPPSGCRKRVPKYFAQMSSTEAIERPRLDFNKMQSKRLVMVRRPVVLRHNYSRPLPSQMPSLELPLDFSNHSFQPVPAQT